MKKIVLALFVFLSVASVISLTPKMQRGKNTYYSSPVIIGSQDKTFDMGKYSLYFTQVDAGTITASVAGNWSNTATWQGGVVPAAGDDVALNGLAITWDVGTVPIIPTTGSLGTITSSGSVGQIQIALDDVNCHGDEACKITATTITAGNKPTTAGIILISGSGSISDHILGIHANIVGGGNANSWGVNNTGTGKVRITGTISGSATGGCRGFNNASTGPFEVIGNVTGGGSAGSLGIYNASTATGTITGTVTGGSAAGAEGVNAYGAGAITVTGNLVNGTSMAWGGKAPVWNPGTTNYWQMTTDSATHYFFGVDTAAYPAGGGGGAWGF